MTMWTTVHRVARQRLGLADIAALAYATLFVAWVFGHTPGLPHNTWIGDLAFFPLGLAVGWAMLSAGRSAARAGLDWRTQAAWRLLAASAALLWVSGSAWTYFVKQAGPTATPPWIDALEYCQLACTMAAALVYPARRRRHGEGVRYWLDIALVFAAAGTVAVHYGTEVVVPWREALGVNLVVLRAAMDWGVFFALAVSVFRARDAAIRTAMRCLLAANVAVLAGNTWLSALPEYRAGHPVDLLWFAAWGFRWVAARSAAWRYRNEPRRDSQPASESGSAVSPLLPHAIVAAFFALLVFHVLGERRQQAPFFACAATGMAALLAARHVAELRANARLFEAAVEEGARFRSLVLNATDLIVVIDGHGRLTYASPSAESLLGNPAPGAPLAAFLAPEDAGVWHALLRGLSTDDEEAQCRLHTTAGTWREIAWVVSDLRDHPDVGGIVLNGRDVTEHNELERRLQHAQRLDAVGHLAGGLAHDFNNILATVKGYTELLEADVPAQSDAAADLAAITQAVDQAAAVTRKLLAFSRRQVVQPVVLDLAGALRSLEPILRHIVTDRVRLTSSCSPDLWPVYIDTGQFEQVLINLATNARDAMPGGGMLELVAMNRAAVTGPTGDHDRVALVVRDSGIGMAPAVRERIFEPFFSTKTRDQGMGLGLAMVHGIVTQSGGHIDVDSREGDGTTFTILLPRASGTPAGPAPRSCPPSLPSGSRSVLLVDDEPSVRHVVRRMLEREGHTVVEADGGVAALAAIRTAERPFDVLLTDLVMPGMHGRELVLHVRREYASIPVVCMSGYAGDPDSTDVHALGARAMLIKPFSTDALMRALADAWAWPSG